MLWAARWMTHACPDGRPLQPPCCPDLLGWPASANQSETRRQLCPSCQLTHPHCKSTCLSPTCLGTMTARITRMVHPLSLAAAMGMKSPCSGRARSCVRATHAGMRSRLCSACANHGMPATKLQRCRSIADMQMLLMSACWPLLLACYSLGRPCEGPLNSLDSKHATSDI
jgi:hypothetical protein